MSHPVRFYQGSPEARYLARQAMHFLKERIHAGDNLRFRNIRELYAAFDEYRCVYALDLAHRLVGFVYFSVPKKSRRPCVAFHSLVVAPSYQNQGMGRQLRNILFDIVKKDYSQYDILSITASPIVIHINQRMNFTEISYQELWETYLFDLIKDCENHPNLTCELPTPLISNHLFKNVQIFHTQTKHILKVMIFRPLIS